MGVSDGSKRLLRKTGLARETPREAIDRLYRGSSRAVGEDDDSQYGGGDSSGVGGDAATWKAMNKRSSVQVDDRTGQPLFHPVHLHTHTHTHSCSAMSCAVSTHAQFVTIACGCVDRSPTTAHCQISPARTPLCNRLAFPCQHT